MRKRAGERRTHCWLCVCWLALNALSTFYTHEQRKGSQKFFSFIPPRRLVRCGISLMGKSNLSPIELIHKFQYDWIETK